MSEAQEAPAGYEVFEWSTVGLLDISNVGGGKDVYASPSAARGGDAGATPTPVVRGGTSANVLSLYASNLSAGKLARFGVFPLL